MEDKTKLVLIAQPNEPDGIRFVTWEQWQGLCSWQRWYPRHDIPEKYGEVIQGSAEHGGNFQFREHENFPQPDYITTELYAVFRHAPEIEPLLWHLQRVKELPPA